jgi:hypothetical protein
MTCPIMFAQNRLILLNSRAVIAQQEGDEQAFNSLLSQIGTLEQFLESLKESSACTN